MTTNNEFKAPRPCTLSKEWTGKGLIDSNNGYDLQYQTTIRHRTTPMVFALQILFISGEAIYKKEITTLKEDDAKKAVIDAKLEVALVIASAQRSWLKAEGFEFDQVTRWYEIIYCYKDEPDEQYYGVSQFVENMNGWDFDDMEAQDWDIIAFKPIVEIDPADTSQQRLAKEQEAWDEVAGVEVWEGVE